MHNHWAGTHFGRVARYTDQSGYVLVPMAIGRGSLTWILGRRQSCRARQNRHPRASGRPPSQALTLVEVVRFIVWRMRRPFLGECRRGPRHFLCLPGVSGLRPCTWTYLKQGLGHTRPVSRTYDKYRNTCVCKIDVKCNIASWYYLAFYSQYSAVKRF